MAKHTVFISHSHADNSICDTYATSLRRLGLDVWYDRNDMEYAGVISEVIGRELQSRTALVVMLTPSSVTSRWVMLEINTYLTFWTKEYPNRLIVPVVLAECEVPPILLSLKYVDATLLTPEDTVDAIARTLGVDPASKHVVVSRLEANSVAASPGLGLEDTTAGQLLNGWYLFVLDKWLAASDSQLGWKPLRGRWANWEEVFGDVYRPDGLRIQTGTDAQRRLKKAREMGQSTASAVASFIQDLYNLRDILANTTPPGRGGTNPYAIGDPSAVVDDREK